MLLHVLLCFTEERNEGRLSPSPLQRALIRDRGTLLQVARVPSTTRWQGHGIRVT